MDVKYITPWERQRRRKQCIEEIKAEARKLYDAAAKKDADITKNRRI